MFQVCKNTPEFIKYLVDEIEKVEKIILKPMIGIGKSTLGFNINLIREIFRRIKKWIVLIIY